MCPLKGGRNQEEDGEHPARRRPRQQEAKAGGEGTQGRELVRGSEDQATQKETGGQRVPGQCLQKH